MLELVTVSTLNGVVYGLLLFMLSSGLTLIFSMMGVLNFAHASFYMLGAYFGYQISRWIGFWPALVIAPLLVGGSARWSSATGCAACTGRPRRRAAVHVRPRLRDRGAGADGLGQAAGRLSACRRSLDFSAFTVFGTNFPAYKVFMMVDRDRDVRLRCSSCSKRTRIGLVIQAALTHPRDGRRARPQRAAAYSCWCSASAARLPALAGVIGGVALLTAADDGARDRARSCSSWSSSAAWARSPARSSPRC